MRILLHITLVAIVIICLSALFTFFLMIEHSNQPTIRWIGDPEVINMLPNYDELTKNIIVYGRRSDGLVVWCTLKEYKEKYNDK